MNVMFPAPLKPRRGFGRFSTLTHLRMIWLIVIASLLLAFIAEYGFGLLPCELCLLQRLPFYLITVVGAASFVPIFRAHVSVLLLLSTLLLLLNAGIASYHTGVEQQWWPGPSSCSGDAASFGDVESLRAHILSAPIIRCDKPALEVMGVTMASANAIFCITLALFGLWSLIDRAKRVSCLHDSSRCKQTEAP